MSEFQSSAVCTGTSGVSFLVDTEPWKWTRYRAVFSIVSGRMLLSVLQPDSPICIRSHSTSSLYVTTWIILNRHTARGDFAAVFYCIAFPCLYWYIRESKEFSDNVLWSFFTLSSTYVASAFGATVLYRLSPWHPLAAYPGPWTWWISSVWFTYVSFMGRRHLILDELHARYGPFVRIGPNTLSINSSTGGAIYSVTTHLDKSDSYRAPGHQIGVTLFFKQPTEKLHTDRKKIWSRLFTSAGVSELYPVLEQRTWELMHTIERRQAENAKGVVDLTACFYHWSYDFMGDIVFGGCNKLELMKNGDPRLLIHGGKMATAILDSVGQTPWLMDLIWHLPVGGYMHRLQTLAGKMMQTRITATELPPFRDLVSYLLEPGIIPLPELQGEAVVAIQGGSDNTSITMALALFFLACEPKYYQKLRKELDATFDDPLGDLKPSKLAELPYLEAVITETLRLGSPYFLPRDTPEGGMMVDGRFIPGGTVVALAAYSQQTSPDNYFPDPLGFHPDRWLPEGLGPGTVTNKSALWSFSAGSHVCVAKAFAYQEMRYVLTRIVLAFDVTLADGFDPTAFRAGMLNMRTTFLEKDLFVNVKRREGVNFDRFV